MSCMILPCSREGVRKKTVGVLITITNEYVTHHAKSDLMGITKSINPGQPEQSMQSEQGRNFLLLADFLCIKR